MTQTYSTKDGDTLDYICWKQYGRSSGAIEAVLDANPGLADLGTVYPAGTIIILPDLPAASTVADTMKLWD